MIYTFSEKRNASEAILDKYISSISVVKEKSYYIVNIKTDYTQQMILYVRSFFINGTETIPTAENILRAVKQDILISHDRDVEKMWIDGLQ